MTTPKLKNEEKSKAAEATLKRLLPLMAKLDELDGQASEVRAEIGKLLRGEPTVGDRLREVEATWDEQWSRRYKTPYMWRWTIDRPATKRLLKQLGPDELKSRMLAYLGNEDAFFRKARHSYGMFVSTINQHVSQSDGDELVLEAGVADCRHTPPCRNDGEHSARTLEDLRNGVTR